MTQKAMTIVSATVENFKRIEVVEITPAGGAVEITGKNRAGKSSILDAIEAALGGKRRQPKKPIRSGEAKARVVVDLGDVVVERVWTGADDRLVVKNKEGLHHPSPQKVLNDLVGVLAFDPLAFMDSSPAEQRATLLAACGIDLADVDAKRAAAFATRRDAGRDLRSARARLESAAEAPEGTPDEPVSAADLTGEMEAAMATQRANDKERESSRRLASDAASLGVRVREASEAVEVAETAVRNAIRHRDLIAAEALDAENAADDARDNTGELVDPDVGAIRSRLAEVEQTNANVRIKNAREAAVAEVTACEVSHAKHEKLVRDADSEKDAILADAEMPIEGLTISDAGLELDGNPFEQAATSQRVRVCTAIAATLNPKLKIALVRSGNDLDDESLAAFYEECARADVQAWVERIAPSSDGAIVIHDGQVKPARGSK